MQNLDGFTDEQLRQALLSRARPLTDEEVEDARRKRALERHLARVQGSGWRVESRSDFAATIAKGQPINHLLHFCIGLFTFGLWWFVWLLMALGGVIRLQVVAGPLGQISEGGRIVQETLPGGALETK